MNICLFSPEEINQPLSVKDERGEHLIKILHKKAGDSFTAGIIGGQAGTAVITEITDTIKFTFEPKSDGKPLTPLKMIIGFPRPIQLKRLLRDIAALGVCEVHLTGTELGEKSYMKSTLVEKGSAYKMLLDGTVQAGGTHVPELYLHENLRECVDWLEEHAEKDHSHHILRLALDNVNPKCSLSEAMTDLPCMSCATPCSESKRVFAAIGSERGWTDKERKLLEDYGYIRCGMGNRIMRTETASTVAGAIILEKIGCLK
ncbi:MAG: 16S rRNA (uracil(1498)-N(3))-methyltransferase [Treponema sp.]|nr:16S rRNA (uracil(1498)-N(3))-methyltransferase [Treponema sp.]